MTELERELVALGGLLDVPDEPFLATRVAASLARSPRRVGLIAAVVAVLLAVGSLNTPVVADWLRGGGVEVRQEAPPVAPRARPAELFLGERSSLATAGADLIVPSALGAPDEVWVQGPIVWFAYRPRLGLPEAEATGYGALFAQARLRLADDVVATKFVEPTTSITPVALGTGPAYWLSGLHSFALRSPSGEFLVERLRVADRVLLWERGDVVFRLESALGMEASLRIARSIP